MYVRTLVHLCTWKTCALGRHQYRKGEEFMYVHLYTCALGRLVHLEDINIEKEKNVCTYTCTLVHLYNCTLIDLYGLKAFNFTLVHLYPYTLVQLYSCIFTAVCPCSVGRDI